MPTNLERAGLIARQVELVSVSLHSANVVSHVDPLDPSKELQLRQGYRARYELPQRQPAHLYVYVDLNFSVEDAANEDARGEQVVLDASYLLVYTLASSDEKPADALQHFAELNGVYNVWPYWRELVQTVTGRVGLAAIVVPVFRPRERRLEGETGESDSVKE